MKEFNRLTVKVQAWFAKPLNGSSGSSSFLMRGGEIPYKYQGRVNVKVTELEEFLQNNKEAILEEQKEIQGKIAGKKSEEKIQLTLLKEELGTSRVVKGIRGAIRHRVMEMLHQRNIEYCSPTLKKEFQTTKEPILLTGEHLMGACETNPCPIRQLFGSLSEESAIRVWSDVIVQTDKPLDKITKQKGLSFAYVSTEIRHVSRRDKKAIQDFSEQYFSGEFQFYVEFLKELPAWLMGLLIQGILNVTHLGKGGNSGYGRVEVKSISFEQVTLERKLGQELNGQMAIVEEENAINLNDKLEEFLKAWSNYN